MSQRWVYFFADGSNRRGPHTLEEMRSFALRPETLVWREGMSEWAALEQVPELWAIFAERFVQPSAGFSPPSDVAVPPVASGISSIQVPQTGFFKEPQIPYATPGALPVDPQDQLPKGMAIAGLVTGILGLIMWCLPGSVLIGLPSSIGALVCSIIARKQIRRGQAGGEGMALAGLILAIVNIVIALIVICILVMFAIAFSTSRPGGAPVSTPAPTSIPVE